MRKTLILTLLLCLTGCMGPHYDVQYVNVPESWRIEADESSTLCNARWWEQFQDPVLDDLILLALRNNQDLHVAISRVFEYYAAVGVTNANLFPLIDANFTYNRVETSLLTTTPLFPGFSRINNVYQSYFSLSWLLDFWGQLRSASEAAYASYLSQIEARRAVVINVVTSVADAYIHLRSLDAQLDVSKRTLESRMKSLNVAKDRFELGETSELEVKQAQSEVENAAISVLILERDIPIQENLLSILLGDNPRNIERGRSIEKFNYPFTIPAGLPSDLLMRRPDVVEAEDNLIAANAIVWEQRALYFPQITLTALFGNESLQLNQLLTSPAQMWQFGIGVVEPIFNASQTYYQVEEAKAQRDEALFTYRQIILNAFREVNDALIACQMNRRLVEERQVQVKVLAEYLYLAKLRYAEGEVDYLNILDAERSFFDGQLSLVQAQGDSFKAIVQLYGALGGGWVLEADSIATD